MWGRTWAQIYIGITCKTSTLIFPKVWLRGREVIQLKMSTDV